MTLEEIRASKKPMLTPADIAEVLGCEPYAVNIQVKEDIANGVNSLGFAVCKVGNRVKIPKKAFLRFMEGEQ